MKNKNKSENPTDSSESFIAEHKHFRLAFNPVSFGNNAIVSNLYTYLTVQKTIPPRHEPRRTNEPHTGGLGHQNEAGGLGHQNEAGAGPGQQNEANLSQCPRPDGRANAACRQDREAAKVLSKLAQCRRQDIVGLIKGVGR